MSAPAGRRRAKPPVATITTPRVRVVRTPKPKPKSAPTSSTEKLSSVARGILDRLLDQAVRDYLAPVEKLPPEALQWVLDQAISDLGLPPPTPEYEFARDIKRRWRIDRAWVALRIALEIEGGIHMRGRHIRPAGFLSDMDKYNELALRAWLLVRISYDMIRDGRALALIIRAHSATRAA